MECRVPCLSTWLPPVYVTRELMEYPHLPFLKGSWGPRSGSRDTYLECTFPPKRRVPRPLRLSSDPIGPLRSYIGAPSPFKLSLVFSLPLHRASTSHVTIPVSVPGDSRFPRPPPVLTDGPRRPPSDRVTWNNVGVLSTTSEDGALDTLLCQDNRIW